MNAYSRSVAGMRLKPGPPEYKEGMQMQTTRAYCLVRSRECKYITTLQKLTKIITIIYIQTENYFHYAHIE
jgi:hypothetical protein